MAFADPQTVTINAVANSLPRISSGNNAGGFSKDDGTVKLPSATNLPKVVGGVGQSVLTTPRLQLTSHAGLIRVVRAWYDRLRPAPARGWTPAGPGWLNVKDVITCVVTTRGGSPNGSRRVARRASRILCFVCNEGWARFWRARPQSH